MIHGLTEDQQQFHDVVRRFLTDKSPATEVRRWMSVPTGYDKETWQQLSQEVGLTGTHLPEAYGGFGFGAVELAITLQEMGRTLYSGPFFASAVMSGYAVLNAATEAQKTQILADIASGTPYALVLDNLNDPAHLGQRLSAAPSGDGWQLSGTAPYAIDAQHAEQLIVAASTDQGLAMFATPADGVVIEPVEALDPTRKLARVSFSGQSATLLGGAGEAHAERLWDQLNTALANEMVGGAEHLFETTIEYLKMRVQFGRPIGSFQALKHRCADLLLELNLARAAAQDAAQHLANGGSDSYAPNMAKALAADAYIAIAKQAIQLRGGIGFTWEEDTHLWYKRAKASEVLLGTSNWHRERMIQRMETEAAA